MKLVIQLLLWIVIGFLGYLTFNSIYQPIQFNKVKKVRYAKVIEKLKDIRQAELAYNEVNGHYTKSFDSLVRFVDTAQFTVTQRRDTSYLDKKYQKTYGVDKMIDDVVIDTLGHRPVKDSIFKGSDRYTKMMYVPYTDNEKFDLDAGKLYKNKKYHPVFEAKIAKSKILTDQDEDLVNQENQVRSVDAVNGKYIKVGSMTEINNGGNWPKVYGKTDE